VTPKSFIASCVPVLAFNAIPVFADIDPRTGCMTSDEIQKKITKKTKAILLVHLFGQPADIDPILELAKASNIRLIEDCAEAYDAYSKGRKVGTIGDVAAFSLQHSKHITTGEGGLFATNDEEMYSRAMAYSNMGSLRGLGFPLQPKGNFFAFGHNHRLSELGAAVGVAQLAKIETFNERRRALVKVIEEELKGVPGISLPYAYPDTVPNYWLYSITFDKDLGLGPSNISELCMQEERVALWSENGYWHHVPCYLEPIFQEMNVTRKTSLGYALPEYVRYEKGLCAKMEDVSTRCAVIPTHHGVSPQTVRSHARAIRRVVERRR
jgi:dTDP-4-amino-4,6-dideoxygalactose transaminase